MENLFEKYVDAVEQTETITSVGYICRARGLLLESRGPQAVIGEICLLDVRGVEVQAEVVALSEHIVSLMAFADTSGIEIGSRVKATGSMLSVLCSPELLGRILGPLGSTIDGKKPITGNVRYPALAKPPPALSRPPIKKRVITGIRAIDGLLACGEGQRLGIFAGSGVGKSTFQGMIARNTAADVNVIALIGERGRELNDFIEQSLGEEGLKRSVLVVATSDQPALARLRGAYIAAAVAEYFRDRGMNVMLLFDSVTRFARAQREIALSIGEVPAQRGYTPSVFELLPKLLERAGASDKGTITAFYTVLVDGDDMDEPISDNVRGILDGHIVLSRNLASRGHYPAVDILQSISRLESEIAGPESKKAARIIKRYIADYAEAEDIINAGAYKRGSNPSIDIAIEKRAEIEDFLIQDAGDKSTLAETLSRMGEIADIVIPESEMIYGDGELESTAIQQI
ncbi:MAG: FliI/YscN family ATPase [Spirochaetaceae bacterium]|jgi:flagellum-specific ATP synthase|nr:FliI/YscN family ATPase [Spirochaetaceae bacterium]